MSRSISRAGSDPFTGILSCSRRKCEVQVKLDVELDQETFEQIHGVTTYLSKEQREEQKSARNRAFLAVHSAPRPDTWVAIIEPRDMDYPSQKRVEREFCSWRCVRLFAAGRETGREV